MSQSIINLLNEKMQDAFLGDFGAYLKEDSAGKFTGHYRGFSLDSMFQPIWVRRGEHSHRMGYEAFLKPCIGGTQPLEPRFAFHYLNETGGLVLFDRICRTLHLLNFLQFKDGQDLLFINVHPSLLTKVDVHGKVFEGIVHAHSVPTSQVVIELEESPLNDRYALERAARNYRDRGFKIAISEFGKEHTSLKWLWKIRPDFIKLNSELIQEAAADAKFGIILPKLVDLIHTAGSQVVVQGIETERQRTIAELSGALYFQGAALGKPAPAASWQKPAGLAGLRGYG